MPIEVKLLDHSHDPIRSLYVAYRTAYSSLKPAEIDARIESERITRAQMLEFVEKRLETGHSSPLEQVWFEFALSGVTRAFSHQFVRHRIGISFEQQSQRYVAFKEGEFPFTLPESVRETRAWPTRWRRRSPAWDASTRRCSTRACRRRTRAS